MKETKPMLYLKYQEIPAPSALGRWRETEKQTPQRQIDGDLASCQQSHSLILL
jgi:hypothetical protein